MGEKKQALFIQEELLVFKVNHADHPHVPLLIQEGASVRAGVVGVVNHVDESADAVASASRG